MQAADRCGRARIWTEQSYSTSCPLKLANTHLESVISQLSSPPPPRIPSHCLSLAGSDFEVFYPCLFPKMPVDAWGEGGAQRAGWVGLLLRVFAPLHSGVVCVLAPTCVWDLGEQPPSLYPEVPTASPHQGQLRGCYHLPHPLASSTAEANSGRDGIFQESRQGSHPKQTYSLPFPLSFSGLPISSSLNLSGMNPFWKEAGHQQIKRLPEATEPLCPPHSCHCLFSYQTEHHPNSEFKRLVLKTSWHKQIRNGMSDWSGWITVCNSERASLLPCC